MSQARGRKRLRAEPEEDESFDIDYAPKAKLQRRRSARNVEKQQSKDSNQEASPKEEKAAMEEASPAFDFGLEDLAGLIMKLSESVDVPAPAATPKKGTKPSLANTFSPSLKAASRVQRSAAKRFESSPNVQKKSPPAIASPASTSSSTLSGEDSPKSLHSRLATPNSVGKRRLSQISLETQNPVIKIRKLEAGLSTRKPVNRAKHALLYVF